jgi:putative N-acetyltransferase (TIGR04045 family)
MPLLSEGFPAPAFFIPGEYRIEEACAPYQKAACFALRRQVFCREQKIFDRDDRDEIDGRATLLVASSCLFGHADEIVGTVRIHEAEPQLWWGSRLAVSKPYRRIGGLGASLIKLAVGTAKFQGAEMFMAHVQAQNRSLFEALNWHVLDQKMIHDRRHYLMQADLGAYEAIDRTAIRLIPSMGERRDA